MVYIFQGFRELLWYIWSVGVLMLIFQSSHVLEVEHMLILDCIFFAFSFQILVSSMKTGLLWWMKNVLVWSLQWQRVRPLICYYSGKTISFWSVISVYGCKVLLAHWVYVENVHQMHVQGSRYYASLLWTVKTLNLAFLLFRSLPGKFSDPSSVTMTSHLSKLSQFKEKMGCSWA